MEIEDTVYLYDGTLDGFCTIVYEVFRLKRIPRQIVSEEKFVGDLFSVPVFYETELKKATKVKNKLNEIGDYIYYQVYTCFLSGFEGKEKIILDYILFSLQVGIKIIYLKHHEIVIAMDKAIKQVQYESHRLKGFVRFQELKNHVLYAIIEPDHHVIEFLVEHFKKRLTKEVWIIHDCARKIMAMYDGKQVYYINADNYLKENIVFSDSEKEFQSLWSMYFKTIAIKERTNSRCQLAFMPKRYWKYLNETKEGTDYATKYN